MMAPLVVVGSVNVDIVLQIARLPLPGETLSAKSYKTFPGGKVLFPFHKEYPEFFNRAQIKRQRQRD